MTSNPQSVASHQEAMRVAIIGACYYMSPSRFAHVTSEFVGRLFPEYIDARKCFVNMRASVL